LPILHSDYFVNTLARIDQADLPDTGRTGSHHLDDIVRTT